MTLRSSEGNPSDASKSRNGMPMFFYTYYSYEPYGRGYIDSTGSSVEPSIDPYMVIQMILSVQLKSLFYLLMRPERKHI